jgi:lysozyme
MEPSAIDLAVRLIQKFEGCKLTAYPDPGTGGEPYTIGWGTTGPDVRPGTVWTQKQADDRFNAHVQEFAAKVAKLVTVPLQPHQMAALISLAYNIGTGALGSSTLLRMVNTLNFDGAAQQFIRWNRAGGKVMAGLTRRRNAEAALFKGEKADFSDVTARVL